MPNNPTDLIPLVQRAYGQPLLVNFDKFNEGLEKNKAEKKEETNQMGSLLDIGADLDAKAWETWEKGLNGVISDLESGNLDYGSTDFYRAQSKLTREAKIAKEATTLIEDMQKNIQKDPDKFQYTGSVKLEDGTEGRYNSGLTGFTGALSEARSKDYDNISDYAQALGGIGNNLKVNPYSASEIDKMARTDGSAYSKSMLEGADAVAVPKYIGAGQLQITTTQSAAEKDIEAATGQMVAKYGDNWSSEYYGKVANKAIDPKEVSLADFSKAKALTYMSTQNVTSSTKNAPAPSPAPPTPEQPIVSPTDVASAVAQAQKNDSIEPLMKYISGNKFKGEVKNGKLIMYQDVDLKDGEKKGEQYEISLGDTEAIYDALSNINKGISRKDLIGQEIPVDRTQEQRKTEIAAQNAIYKKGADIISQLSSQRDGDQDVALIQSINDLDGVRYSNAGWGDDTIYYMGKDDKGESVEKSVKATPANKKLIQKILSIKGWKDPSATVKTTEPTQISSQSEYESLKKGDTYIWDGVEYTKE